MSTWGACHGITCAIGVHVTCRVGTARVRQCFVSLSERLFTPAAYESSRISEGSIPLYLRHKTYAQCHVRYVPHMRAVRAREGCVQSAKHALLANDNCTSTKEIVVPGHAHARDAKHGMRNKTRGMKHTHAHKWHWATTVLLRNTARRVSPSATYLPRLAITHNHARTFFATPARFASFCSRTWSRTQEQRRAATWITQRKAEQSGTRKKRNNKTKQQQQQQQQQQPGEAH